MTESPPNPKILIVDDDQDIRRLMRAGLTPLQFSVTEAENVSRGRTLCHEAAFDLLVTDLSLPDGHGLDVIRTMRELHPDAPCLVVTGGDPAHDVILDEILKLPKVFILRKPFRLAELREAVAAALADAPSI